MNFIFVFLLNKKTGEYILWRRFKDNEEEYLKLWLDNTTLNKEDMIITKQININKLK